MLACLLEIQRICQLEIICSHSVAVYCFVFKEQVYLAHAAAARLGDRSDIAFRRKFDFVASIKALPLSILSSVVGGKETIN